MSPQQEAQGSRHVIFDMFFICPSQVEDRLMSAKRKNQHGDAALLADFIDEVKAAQDWTLKSIPDKSHAKLCEAFTLLSPKFDVPFENKVAFTLRLASDLLTARQFDKMGSLYAAFLQRHRATGRLVPG